MRKHFTVFALAFGLLVSSAPVMAQSAPAPKTCSQVYDQCFDGCSRAYPGVNENSARCIDRCTMARAQCDRSGCFKDGTTDVCGLSKQ